MIIRKATEEDARQIAEILVEDWQTAYRGIIDSAYLDSMSVEERYRREAQRYGIYTVAAAGKEILGFVWNSMDGGDGADHEAALADMEQALLGSELGEMIVTPREIDSLVQDAAGVIASAVNRALQPSLSDAEIAAMMD